MNYELSKEQKEFIKQMVLYCIRKLEGVESKIGDRSIFVHILKNCFKEYSKGLIDETEIGVIPIKINEILITVYGNEVATINLKSEKGKSFVDIEDLDYTVNWKI